MFGGATLATVYAPGDSGDQLCLIEAAGVPRSLYGLRDSYALSGGSPAADAYRIGRPLWLSPEELAVRPGARPMPAGTSGWPPCRCPRTDEAAAVWSP